MWNTKTFKTKAAMQSWINKNNHRYQIEVIYVNNGYGITYKRLLRVY